MGKRLFDILVATGLLCFLWPLFLVIALAIRLTSPGPALFRQERQGLGERPFTIYKFRTMVVGACAARVVERDDPRITPLGRSLRACHLDELPQLWNVLLGDMSLVGPRPLPLLRAGAPPGIDRFGERHRVRPGMTGLGQMRGRACSQAAWRRAYRADILYVRQRCFCLDLALLARTPAHVFLRRGV